MAETRRDRERRIGPPPPHGGAPHEPGRVGAACRPARSHRRARRRERGPASPRSCPCGGGGCSSHPSPSCVAPPASWPPTWLERRRRACRCSCAGTPTWRTSGSSPRPSVACCSTSTTSTRPRPGPWEWDLKRLAASAVVVGRMPGMRARRPRPAAARAAARSYRRHMARFAAMGTLDVWYERVDAKAALRIVGRSAPVTGALGRRRRPPPDVTGGAAQADRAHRRGSSGASPIIHPW